MSKRDRPSPRDNSGARRARIELVDVPSQRLQAARFLMQAGRHDEALAAFREAMRIEPNNVRAYIEAARAYAERFELEQLDAVLAELSRRGPTHPGVHHYVGETFNLLRLTERALDSFEQAARLPGAGPPTWLELAELYESVHRLEEAGELVKRVRQAGFAHPRVRLLQGRIERRQNLIGEAETTFRSVAEGPAADSKWAAQAWGELALIYDSQGDFSGAVTAIDRCKVIQQARAGQMAVAADRFEADMRAMVGAITRDDLGRWRQAFMPSTPRRVALLTGFPRSGTTLLEQVLAAHSDLVSVEERDFLGSEILPAVTQRRGSASLMQGLNSLTAEEIELQRERYLRFMNYVAGGSIGKRMLLDKNPAYNLMIPLALRIFPEMRLAVMLRDPRDVVLSCYLRYLPLNIVSVNFLDIRRTANRYALDMAAWLKLRDLLETPWCEVRYEKLVASLETEAKNVVHTLGLTWEEGLLNYRAGDAARHVKSPSYEAVARPVYSGSIHRWRNYEELLRPTFELLAPIAKSLGYET